ncbi:hypothetical protein BYT27DRAFT_7163161 [Phlegmacium glaucopus]|nr:hypothetical protein BYT27DRAFT_7163161 [Phlegmacium glaucopus]
MNLAIRPSGLQFLCLPEELQVEILMHVDYRSLLRCTSVCKSLNHTIKEYSGIQYIIELGANGMEAASASCTLSHTELLQKLRDHLKAWDQLDWKRFRVLPSGDFTACRAYELVAGTFSTSNGLDLFVMWLPSATHDGRALRHNTIGFSIRDFAIDPTEDVIAFLENESSPSSNLNWTIRLHLRTISSNRPHPLAREGTLSFNMPSDAIFGNFMFNATLQLAYDMLVLSITTGPSSHGLRALVWNWKTGCLVFDSQDDPTIMDNSQAFTMLNHKTFMLTSTYRSGSLKVYAISHCERSPATLLATLHLPEVQPGFYVRNLDSHSGPVHARSPENSSFTSSLESRIQVISAFYDGPIAGDLFEYSIFIHNDHLLSIAKSSSVGSDLPWHSWGPQHTRFLPHCVPTNWLRYVHGQRVICSTPDNIQVLDFARSKHVPSTGAHEMFSRSNPSCIPKSSQPIFVEDVVTHLPYYTVNRPISQRFFAYMIDEERIIGLRTTSSEHLELHLLAL